MKQYVIYCDNGLEGEKRKTFYVGTYNSLDLAEGIVRILELAKYMAA